MNTGLYCLVNIPTADTVLQGPQLLPQNWQAPDGTWHMNINNESVWTDSALLTIGWYPYVESDAGTPGPYHDRSLSAFVINPTTVVRNAIYTQWDIERVRNSKNAELEATRRQYTLQDKALNPHVEGYMRDDAEWMSQKQAELARLTVWEDVAAFDSQRPLVAAFSNTYVGQKHVDEGYKLTAQNQAAMGANQGALWDQTIINSFVSANQLAAQDSSGSQSPADPAYQIRQGVGKVNEQFARIVIYREPREDANPALRTTYKMRLYDRNPDDLRNLYVFSYTNGTYLTWRLFEDLGNKVWGLEATAAEWQYVPLDMAFIFSYGTNQAVEADYFTDRVEFPAGVQEMNILVAWDPA